jgi:hypothetical protein
MTPYYGEGTGGGRGGAHLTSADHEDISSERRGGGSEEQRVSVRAQPGMGRVLDRWSVQANDSRGKSFPRDSHGLDIVLAFSAHWAENDLLGGE